MREIVKKADDTAELLIDAGAVTRVPEVFTRHFPGRRPLVVCDENTFEVAGGRVHELLRQAGLDPRPPLIFPGRPVLHPESAHVNEVSVRLRESDGESKAVGVAVGSGTLNDIVKLASHRADRRYMVVGTAASMDGYASFGASILAEGYKTTIPCPAPSAVVADVDVIAAAPADMTASGYADLVGKITAGADWLIADELGVQSVDPEIWAMVQPPLRGWIGDPEGLRRGELRVISGLFEGLTVSALAMQAYRDTRPASGTEHLFSHVWEMQNLEFQGRSVSHGFKVGLGTLAATALMEVLFGRDISEETVRRTVASRPSPDERKRSVEKRFGNAPFAGAVVDASLSKLADEDELQERTNLALRRWTHMRERVGDQLLPFDEVRSLLRSAGCPVTPEEIGMTRQRLAETFALAQMIRTRYTVLDLAFELGMLENCVEEIFASGRYFTSRIPA